MTGESDTGPVPDGALFARFAEGVVLGPKPALDAARQALADRLGPAAVVDAAAVAALFHAINRVADAIGIQVEASKRARTADFRKSLRLDDMPTARIEEG